MVYQTKGVCSREIHIETKDGIVKSVNFIGGCSGNSQGVARLTEGMKIEDAIQKLEGIKCGNKSTSCPDQLAQALKTILA